MDIEWILSGSRFSGRHSLNIGWIWTGCGADLSLDIGGGSQIDLGVDTDWIWNRSWMDLEWILKYVDGIAGGHWVDLWSGGPWGGLLMMYPADMLWIWLGFSVDIGWTLGEH